jgi:hypothetical protein
MHNESLVQYIKTVQAQGFSEVAIREVLVKNGWQPVDINNAFSYMALSGNVPPPPNAPGSQAMPASTQTSRPLSTVTSNTIEYNSPYSVGLAVVLFSSLLILVNKIIDDSHILTTGPNQKLIFDAVIILPFLILAFVLNGSFSENKKQFRILSKPYFIVSAILLVRLLWDTSLYVLSANATYGVYIVLIMVILVLTGAIIFVRKFMLAEHE